MSPGSLEKNDETAQGLLCQNRQATFASTLILPIQKTVPDSSINGKELSLSSLFSQKDSDGAAMYPKSHEIVSRLPGGGSLVSSEGNNVVSVDTIQTLGGVIIGVEMHPEQ